MVKGQSKFSGARKSDRQAIRDWPVTERPREKLLNLGPEGLSDGESLAVLLRIGKAGQSAEDLAHQLMSMFTAVPG
jgi:DNA repair protein RadC